MPFMFNGDGGATWVPRKPVSGPRPGHKKRLVLTVEADVYFGDLFKDTDHTPCDWSGEPLLSALFFAEAFYGLHPDNFEVTHTRLEEVA